MSLGGLDVAEAFVAAIGDDTPCIFSSCVAVFKVFVSVQHKPVVAGSRVTHSIRRVWVLAALFSSTTYMLK